MDIVQADFVVCDNPSCDYKVENPGGDPRADLSDWVDKPCPKCGENLLTQEDYELHNKMMVLLDAIVDLIPESKEPIPEDKMVTGIIKARDGKISLTIDKKKDENN